MIPQLSTPAKPQLTDLSEIVKQREYDIASRIAVRMHELQVCSLPSL
jgi:hypothetical protein